MAIPLPKTWLQRIRARPSTYDIGGVASGMVSSAASGYRFFLDQNWNWATALALAVVIQGGFGLAKWRAAFNAKKDRERGDEKIVDGVLYLDSTAPGFFTESRTTLALYAAVEIAIFVGRRYTD